jgi:RHS repeat-associated protein
LRRRASVHRQRAGHTTRYAYIAATGLLQSVTDPLGRTTTYGYDTAGERISVTDPTGATTLTTYDATGRVRSVVDPRGTAPGADPKKFTTTYDVYDGHDRVRKQTNAVGSFKLWEYDAAGRLRQSTDGNGFVTNYFYDDAGRLTKQIDPDLRVNSYGYTDGGRLSRATDGVGDVTTYGYDPMGRLARTASPRGNVPGADPAPFTATYIYDYNSNLIEVDRPHPGGGVAKTRTTYDAADRPVATIDPLNNTTQYRYDGADNLTQAIDPATGSVSWDYDGTNRVSGSTDPRGHKTVSTYDAAGQVTAETAPNGDRTTYGYDKAGHRTSMTSPRGNVPGADPAKFTTLYTYDRAGNQTSVTDPLGNKSTVDYDAANRVVRRTDANGHSTIYQYDGGDRVRKVIGPDAGSVLDATTNDYDHAGNLITRWDAKGSISRYEYDAAGRLSRTIDPLGQRREYAYDPDGHLTSIVTARGTSAPSPQDRAANTITLTYDNLGRLTGRDLGGKAQYSYGYDAADRLTSLADPTGQQVRAYDAASRLKTVTRGTDTYSYAYDQAGDLTSRTLPDGTVQRIGYDDLSRPTSQTGPLGSTTYAYDPDGNLTQTVLPGGSRQVRTFDTADRLASLTNIAPGGSTVSAYSVSRDKVGNPVRVDSTQAGVARSEAYRYDAADRLTAMCYQAASCAKAANQLQFTYDKVGNRTSRKRVGSKPFTETYTYNAADELTARRGGPDGSVTYAYDADGNQTQAGTVKTAYNLDNKPVSVSDGRRTTTFTIDAAGLRTAADTSGGTGGPVHTAYQWDTNATLPLLTGVVSTGTPTRGYTYGPDGLPQTVQVGTAGYLLDSDPFGNVTEVTDTAGTVDGRFTMVDPFGGFVASPGSVDPRVGFQGQYDDPLTGALYLRARDYAPAVGTFTSTDPAPGTVTTTASSAYAFGNDNPLVHSDPSGMFSFQGIIDAVRKIIFAERTWSHNAAVRAAPRVLKEEVIERGGDPSGVQTEYQIDAASKKQTGNEGKADIVYNTPTELYIWEVKSKNVGAAQAMKEAGDYGAQAKLLPQNQAKNVQYGWIMKGIGIEAVPQIENRYVVAYTGGLPGAILYMKFDLKDPRQPVGDPNRVPVPEPTPVPVPAPTPAPAPTPGVPPGPRHRPPHRGCPSRRTRPRARVVHVVTPTGCAAASAASRWNCCSCSVPWWCSGRSSSRLKWPPGSAPPRRSGPPWRGRTASHCLSSGVPWLACRERAARPLTAEGDGNGLGAAAAVSPDARPGGHPAADRVRVRTRRAHVPSDWANR